MLELLVVARDEIVFWTLHF